jgi:hypothetical protein
MSDIETSLLTIVGTATTVVLANNLNFRRTSREKSWELRRVVYGEMLYALGAAESVCSSIDDAIAQYGDGVFQNGMKSLDAMDEQLASCREIARKNYIILSGEFIELFEKFNKASYSDYPDGDFPPEIYDRESAAIRQYRPLLLDQARKEIVFESKSWWNRLMAYASPSALTARWRRT